MAENTKGHKGDGRLIIVFVAIKEPHMSFGQVGMEIIAGVLTHAGHSVHGLVDSTYDPSDYLTNDEKRNLNKIGTIEPYLVGISVLSHRYQWCLKFARLIKQEYPNIRVIFGGPHATAVPKVVIQEDCVDMVCVVECGGCGETKLKHLRSMFDVVVHVPYGTGVKEEMEKCLSVS